MFDENAAANALFGGSMKQSGQSAPTPPNGQAPRTLIDGASSPPEPESVEERFIAAVYPEPLEVKKSESVPENIQSLRDADPARKMFTPAVGFREVPLEAAFADVQGITDEQKAAAAQEYREIIADVGASAADATGFLALVRHHIASPPDQATEDAWHAEASEELTRRFGDEAQSKLEEAKKLLARDPRLGVSIRQAKLNNHPQVIMKLIELAHTQRFKGRLG